MILTCDSAGPVSCEVNVLFGSDINIKVKGSGRGRPLYTNNIFTSPAAGPALSHVRIIIVMPRTDAS